MLRAARKVDDTTNHPRSSWQQKKTRQVLPLPAGFLICFPFTSYSVGARTKGLSKLLSIPPTRLHPLNAIW